MAYRRATRHGAWLSCVIGARAQVYLEADGREVEARLVGARLERTQLQQVAKRIKIVHKPFLIGKMGGFVQARRATHPLSCCRHSCNAMLYAHVAARC